MLLYDELVSWYRLVDPPEDHADEVRSYREALEGAIVGPAERLLELGSGAGHNVLHLKSRFRCTLSDLSPSMLALSRELHPELEHHEGDLRTLRLGRTFDAVLVHDAICYVTTEADLEAAARTAFVHLRSGGAAVFAPDYTRENFREQSSLLEYDQEGRSMRGLEWTWDPDPNDTSYTVEYSFLLRENGEVRVMHDRHVEGLFDVATWNRVLSSVGFVVSRFARPLDDDGQYDEVFLAKKP